jgi:molybdate-binding protein
LLLLSLLASAGIDPAALNLVRPDCVTGADIADRIKRGDADCGIATRSVAQAAGMSFVPLIWERFDLVLRQRDYFLPGPSALFGFVRSDRFRQRAAELGGYDLTVCGEIRLVN